MGVSNLAWVICPSRAGCRRAASGFLPSTSLSRLVTSPEDVEGLVPNASPVRSGTADVVEASPGSRPARQRKLLMSRILIVDDDPMTLDVLDFALTLDGHTISRAVNGAGAITTARQDLPDLVVLDSMMPVTDGLTAARVLRTDEATAHIPIVMLTAKSMDADIWEGYRTGVASYVTKPLDLTVLQGEIRRLEQGISRTMEAVA